MRHVTLTARVAVLFSLVSSLVLLATGFVLSFVLYLTIERDSQRYLTQTADGIVNDHLMFDNGQIFFRLGPQGETLVSRARDRDVSVLIMDARFEPIGTFGFYRNIAGTPDRDALASPAFLQSVVDRNVPVYRDIRTLGNVVYDTYTLPLVDHGVPIGVMQIAKHAQIINDLLSENVRIILTALPVSLIASWMLGYLVVKQSLSPLARLVSDFQRFEAGDTPHPVAIRGNPNDEVGTLVRAFNDMLDRIAEGIEQQQSFVAHASHELNTPITRAVSSLDVAIGNLKHRQYRIGLQNVVDIKQDLLHLGQMISSLLALSRVTGATTTQRSMKIDVREQIDRVLRSFGRNIRVKRLAVTIRCPKPFQVRFNPQEFHILLVNIIGNAVKYNRGRGRITIVGKTSASGASIQIDDTGIGMGHEEIRHIFDRFYRGPQAAQSAKGSGLGMSIVKEICDRNRLGIRIKSTTGKGTVVTVSDIPAMRVDFTQASASERAASQ